MAAALAAAFCFEVQLARVLGLKGTIIENQQLALEPFLLLNPWEASVFAQAGVDNEYLSGNGAVNATGDYSSASGQVSTPLTLTLNVSGQPWSGLPG
jgi:hypothetical protein